MYLSIFLFFMCVNFSLGILTVPNSPLYLTDNCYFPSTEIDSEGNRIGGAPLVDPALLDGTESMSDIVGELKSPTNSTTTDTSWGGGEVLNTFTDPFARTYKAIEWFTNFVTGGFVLEVLRNVGTCTTGNDPNNPIWDYIIGGIEVVMLFLISITVFYFVTGRGGLLSS